MRNAALPFTVASIMFLGIAGVLFGGMWAVAQLVHFSAMRTAEDALAVPVLHHVRVVRTAVQQDVETTVRGIAFGDVMLDRAVESLMRKYGEDYPFAGIKPLFEKKDIVFANLEGPIVEQHVQTPDDSLRFSFPQSTAQLLRHEGFTTMSVANNHGLDHGEAGSAFTRTALASAGIEAVGHSSKIDARYVVTKHINGQSVIFLGFHATQSSFDETSAVALVQSFAEDQHAFVIISVHWGTEYRLRSNAFQAHLSHAFIDAGADLILGHHPHVVEEVAVYKNRAIFYSLGNCIFDQYFSTDTQQELGVAFFLDAERVQYTLLPIQSIKSQPSPMEATKAANFLGMIADRSDEALAAELQNGTLTLARD